ncbi:MAG: insulinase family protein [Ruminococcaceae bacterium]|nr:insulinase family protein [Oscillospiraceae bacterium]
MIETIGSMKKISKNADIFILPADKFKTFSVSFNFFTELTAESVTKNALFPFLLKLGSKNYPDMLSVNKRLQELYGGVFECRVAKRGDMHMLSFVFEFLRPEYSDSEQLENSLTFMKEMLTNPLVKNGGFSEEFVAREKENLTDYINGIINDKREYTTLRLIEEMFEGDSYALYEYGKVSDLANISAKDLYNSYLEILKIAPLMIFISGNLDENRFMDTFSALLEEKRKPLPINKIYHKNLPLPKKVEENENLVQGKFALGFSTGVSSEDEDYYALNLLNSVFGSGPHSKLFMNVREKMSLCYYVYSRLNRLKGTMQVGIGTDKENFKKAHDAILEQLELCKKGEITEEEIAFSKKFIVGILKQTADNQHHIADFYMTGILAGRVLSPEEYIKKIEALTKEDLVRVAKNITLQTEYYLS